MKNLIIVIIIVFLSNLVFAVSKKDSLNKGKAILDTQTMFDAGTWSLYMEQCAGKAKRKFLNDLAKLSWADFVNFKKGESRYASNYTAGACGKKDTDRGKGFYNWIIAELENKTTFLDNSIVALISLDLFRLDKGYTVYKYGDLIKNDALLMPGCYYFEILAL